MTTQHKEWFWSEDSAKRAAKRLERKGCSVNVRYAMSADGRHDWLLEVFA